MHVLLVFSSRYDTRNMRVFDWDGVHPNWQRVRGRKNGRDAKRVYDYVTKDGDFVEWPQGAQWAWSGNSSSHFAAAIAASSAAEAREIIQSEAPRDYVLGLERIEYFLDRHFQPATPEFRSHHVLDDFRLAPVISGWVRDNLGYVSDLHSLSFLTLTEDLSHLDFVQSHSALSAQVEQVRRLLHEALGLMFTLQGHLMQQHSEWPITDISYSTTSHQSPSLSSAHGSNGSEDSAISSLPGSTSNHSEFLAEFPQFFF